VQVYWDSVSKFAKQPLTIKSEFLQQLPMFSGLSNDLLLFLSCIVEYISPNTRTIFYVSTINLHLCRHRQFLKGRELIRYGSTVSLSNHPVLFVMKGSVSLKTAVAQLGKDMQSTAKVEPGVEFVEKKQQLRLQVILFPTSTATNES
jgi:hypothetical protein